MNIRNLLAMVGAGVALAAAADERNFGWPQVSADLADGTSVLFTSEPGEVVTNGLRAAFSVQTSPRWTRAFYELENRGDSPCALDKIRFFDAWRPTAEAAEDLGEVSGSCDGSVMVYPLSHLFVAVEHPMTKQQAIDGKLTASLAVATPLAPGEKRRWSCVFGMFAPGQLRRDFQSYLEAVRAHAYRVFPHYNSWFDDIGILRSYGSEDGRMTEAECLAVMRTFAQELSARGVTLDSYLWDDGWDNWDSLWDFQKGFPNGFATLANEAHKMSGCSIGAWMSPCGGYDEPCRRRIANAVRQGLAKEGDDKLKLSNPVYYAAFRDRVLQMIRDYDMNIFKFDRLGGGTVHYAMDPKFNAEVEAMLRLTGEMRTAKPDIFINATVGTWASPFWLLHVDSVWRGGWDFRLLGTGSGRQRWLTYRDNRIHDRLAAPSPLFPLNSVMSHGIIVSTNHMPAAASCADTPEATRDFADEVWTSVGSGTSLQELYVSANQMHLAWWDILAAGIKYLRANEKVFRDTHWIGGDPMNAEGEGEVYGYAAWADAKGIVTVRNPSDRPQRLSLTVADALELPADHVADKVTGHGVIYAKDARVSVPASVGDNLVVDLEPYGTVVLELFLAGGTECPFKAGERIAFLGDSITQYGAMNVHGWVKLVERTLSAKVGALSYVEAGVAGNTSRDMAKRLKADVLAKKPNWMFFSCGVNDTPNPAVENPGYPLADYKVRVNEIFNLCESNGVKVICLTATPVYEAQDYRANELEKDYNVALKEIALARRYPVIDVWKVFDERYAEKADKGKRLYTVDGTHLNPVGDRLFAKTVLATFGLSLME